MSRNRTSARREQRRQSKDASTTVQAGLASTLVMPALPSSIRLARHAVAAWLPFAQYRYNNDTLLLLVTEIVATAIDYSNGPLVLNVSEGAGMQVRVEVKDSSPRSTSLASGDVDAVDDNRRLHMISALTNRWGRDVRLVDDAAAVRTLWFECDGIAAEATTVPSGSCHPGASPASQSSS